MWPMSIGIRLNCTHFYSLHEFIDVVTNMGFNDQAFKVKSIIYFPFCDVYFATHHLWYWYWLLGSWLDIWAIGVVGGSGPQAGATLHARVTVPGESTPVFLSNPSSPNDACDLLRNHWASASEAAVKTQESNWWPAKMRFRKSPELLTFGTVSSFWCSHPGIYDLAKHICNLRARAMIIAVIN